MRRDDDIPDLQPPSRSFQEMKVTPYPLTKEGLGQFYEDSYAVVVRRFMMLGFDMEQVREAAQDVYLSLYGKLNSLRQEVTGAAYGAPLFGWTTQAVNWRLKNLNRSEIVKNTIVSSGIVESRGDMGSNKSVEIFLDDMTNSLVVHDAVDRLPPAERASITGKYFEGLKTGEIADNLGLSKDQVERKISQGLQHARDILTRGQIRKAGRPKKVPQSPSS